MTFLPRNPALRVVVVACLLTAFGYGLYAAEQPPTTIEKFLSMRMLRSPSGRFVGYGTNTVQVSDLVRWADDTAERLDRLLGVMPPQGRPPIRMVLTVDPGSTSGWVRVASVSPALHFVVANYETVDVHAARRALVDGLLAEFSTWGTAQKTAALAAPAWLVTGMMRNMDPALRESDYEATFAVWREGRVPPLAECLAGLQSDTATNAAMTGVLVQWMLSLKGKDSCIREVMSRASGGAAPRADWFYTFTGCRIPADLDAAWERWLMGRQWVIGETGRRPEWLVEQIRSERLIYPADSGIPNGKPGDPPLTLKDLIRERKAKWAREAASSRAVRLRLLAAGRANEVSDVLNAYSRFLEAVNDGRSEARLKSLLDDADRRFAALEAAMAGGTSGTNAASAAPRADDGRKNQ